MKVVSCSVCITLQRTAPFMRYDHGQGCCCGWDLSALKIGALQQHICLRCLSFARWCKTEKHSCRSSVLSMRSYIPQYPRSSIPLNPTPPSFCFPTHPFLSFQVPPFFPPLFLIGFFFFYFFLFWILRLFFPFLSVGTDKSNDLDHFAK